MMCMVKCFIFIGTALSNRINFQSLTTCNCLAQNVTYECTVSGGAFTVWSGSAFMCQGEEIPLRHFGFLAASGECNNGAIIGRGVEITNNNCYTSQLSVRLSLELVGRTVTCSIDDGLNSVTQVGTTNLTVSTSKPLIHVYRHFFCKS